ncbi:MAG: PAS domain-containing protein [Candidatus Acidiferrales bacterium]
MSQRQDKLTKGPPPNPAKPEAAPKPTPARRSTRTRVPTQSRRHARPLQHKQSRAPQGPESTTHTLHELLGSIVDFAAEFSSTGLLLNRWTTDKSLLLRPVDQMLAKRLRDLVGDEAYKSFRDVFPRVHRTGKAEDFEYVLSLADGEHCFLARAIPIDHPDGDSRTIRILVQDITRWKQTEEHSHKIDALLAHTQELANVGSWEYDTEPRTFLWSDQMYRMLGFEPSTEPVALGQACALFHPDDRARVWQDVLALIETGRPLENELRFVAADGTARTFYSRAIPVLSHDGKVHRIRGISQDITARKAAEEKLRNSEALLAQAEQVANLGSWEIDSEGHFPNWSENLYRVLQIEPQQQPAPHDEFWSRTHSDDAKRARHDLQLALTQGRAFEHEVRYTRPTGDLRTLFVRGMPILDAGAGGARIVGVTQDVTEQKEAQRARRDSEERYQLLVDALKDYAIFTLDCGGYVTSWNLGAEYIHGYRPEEILGRHFSCFYPTDDIASEKPIRELQQALKGGQLEDEGWRVRKDGSRFWADVMINSLREDQGVLKGFATITRDMTDRRNAGEELRKRQTMLSQAEILANMGSWEIDAIENSATWSDHLFRMLGIDPPASPASLEEIWNIVKLENLEDTQQALAKAIQHGQTFNHIERHRSPNGQIRILHSRGIPITDLRGRTIRLVGTTQDITDRTRREIELRGLSQQLLNVRDEERRRVARNLHETVVQSMAAMKMLLGRVGDLTPKSNSRARKLIQSSSETADDIISQVRTISHLLHPPLLDEAGLYPALNWYAHGFSERSGIVTKVEMEEHFGRLAQETELAIFRVVQEALTNVHRHSGSPEATIRVQRDDDSVRVEVEDRGRGMAQSRSIAPQEIRLGVGTAGMRERVVQLGGQFEIKSAPDKGTTVCVRLPISQAHTNL